MIKKSIPYASNGTRSQSNPAALVTWYSSFSLFFHSSPSRGPAFIVKRGILCTVDFVDESQPSMICPRTRRASYHTPILVTNDKIHKSTGVDEKSGTYDCWCSQMPAKYGKERRSLQGLGGQIRGYVRKLKLEKYDYGAHAEDTVCCSLCMGMTKHFG